MDEVVPSVFLFLIFSAGAFLLNEHLKEIKSCHDKGGSQLNGMCYQAKSLVIIQ